MKMQGAKARARGIIVSFSAIAPLSLSRAQTNEMGGGGAGFGRFSKEEE